MSNLSFEEKMDQLEKLVKELETGDLSLDKSVKLYQEGINLAKECHQELSEASKSIVSLREESGLKDFTK